MLQLRWEMLRWVSSYLDENQEQWEIEKRERERKVLLEEWDKAERFRKIEILRERDRKKREEKEKGTEEKNLSVSWTWEAWRKNGNTVEVNEPELGPAQPEDCQVETPIIKYSRQL